jgi:multidrug resistance protein
MLAMPPHVDERSRLLPDGQHDFHRNDNNQSEEEVLEFGNDDHENPRQFPKHRKYIQVLVVFIIGLICPMASSMLAPAIDDIGQDLGQAENIIVLGQTGFVCMLGIGPLFLAPMSETFGRRPVFLLNLTIFTLLQIPTALAPNVATFIAFRTLAGLFGSVGVANGGGTISDLFETHERATVLGFYLMGPLLGTTLGPFAAGLIVANLHWRWIFWIMLMFSAVVTIGAYFLLHESNATIILQERKEKLQKQNPDKKYHVKGSSDASIFSKIASNSTKATKILFKQPIVMTMSTYQALIFASMYSLYTMYDTIWQSPPYAFSPTQVALAYLGPATGFILTAGIVVPFIDPVYNALAKRNGNDGKPEYRLPLANIGAICLPISLFWFGWAVEKQLNWPIPVTATLLFGASQVSIFNTVQNYYIDSFEGMAASALAAGAFLRSMIGGIVPLFVPKMVESIGYGWGLSVFGFVSVLLVPAPLLFYWYGARLREKFAIDS